MINYIFSNHALEQLKRRSIKRSTIEHIVENPDEIIEENNKKIYQGIIKDNSKRYLYRIFVNTNEDPYVIITAYKTSKIDKYYEGKV